MRDVRFLDRRGRRPQSARRMLLVLLIAAFVSVAAVHADSISTLAYINLLDGPNQDSSDVADSMVSSMAQAEQGTAVCQADTALNLMTFASSADMGLIYPSHCAANYLSGFQNYRSSLDTYVPPGSYCRLEGTLNASSEPGNLGSIGNASVYFLVETASGHRSSSVTFQSQGGIPRLLRSGDEVQGHIHARITPVVNLSGHVPLIKSDFVELGLDYDLWHLSLPKFDATVWEGVAAEIASLIFDAGLSRLDILPGVEVHIGFDVEFEFNVAAEFPADLDQGTDALLVNLQSDAQTSPGATAESSFTSTLARH